MARNHSLDVAGILDYYQARTNSLVECTRQLVAQDTPTGDAAANRRFVRGYRELLEAAGVRCREYETQKGVHLAGDWPAHVAAGEGSPDVAFVLHSDTVWPSGEVERRPPDVRDGKLYGPGVYDMKASLTQVLAFFEFLRDSGLETDRRFRVFVSADEEHGSVEAREFLEREISPRTFTLVAEPPTRSGDLKISRKGVGIYELEIRGLAAHAGSEPELGVNAIDELVTQIAVLRSLRDPDRGVTINVEWIEGGTASNVIPDAARAAIDLRLENVDDGDRIDSQIKTLASHDPRVDIEIRGGIVFPPMVPGQAVLDEATRYVGLARDIGLAVGMGHSGGGSDGSFLAARGVVTLDGLGIDGGGAHSLDEHIVVERLPVRSALLAAFALGSGPKPGLFTKPVARTCKGASGKARRRARPQAGVSPVEDRGR